MFDADKGAVHWNGKVDRKVVAFNVHDQCDLKVCIGQAKSAALSECKENHK